MERIIEFKNHSDFRGDLTIIDDVLPFEIKSVCYIYGVVSENTLCGETKALDFLSNTIDEPIMQWKSGGVISNYNIKLVSK